MEFDTVLKVETVLEGGTLHCSGLTPWQLPVTMQMSSHHADGKSDLTGKDACSPILACNTYNTTIWDLGSLSF